MRLLLILNDGENFGEMGALAVELSVWLLCWHKMVFWGVWLRFRLLFRLWRGRCMVFCSW